MTFEELKAALETLGLTQHHTLGEIKTRHREMVKRYHPDTGKMGDEKVIREINAAYRILHEYMTTYRYLFSEREFLDQHPEERLRRQFLGEP